MEYVITTEQLTKRFGKQVAINNLTLNIPTGCIFAFLGPNGAGKTTTIKALMNILSPNAGTSTVFGVDSRKLSPTEFAQIGYVSENQELPLWMKTGYFLNYCKSFYPTWDDGFCQQLLKQFDIPLDKKLKSLSRGMRMKAALVSSLAYRPKLLVLDEPFSGLDPLVREEFVSGILEVTETENWTIFISSHDVDEVERLADRVGIIDKGALMVNENIEELQCRFRWVEVTLGEAPAGAVSFPAEWLAAEQKGRAVRFVDTQYQEDAGQQRIRSLLPACTDIAAQGMSLREIFVVLAKQFKQSNS
ncbi:MAG: ABC transporter ATP-binding protein [Planctomycetes bacterium]|nr:ABC transporter ATP-binding protein [Planctomycetota bacterium]